MKIYIITDLEGPAGVERWNQTRIDDSPDKLRAMHMLTAEVNAAVEGIHDADRSAEIVVWDGHGSGGIMEAGLSRAARFLPQRDNTSMPGFDPSFDGLMFVGQHAMAGTPAAPLCHTYSSLAVEKYELNGCEIGEFGCRAALAGELNVPTIFISGDDKACIEAKALVPEIFSVETKIGTGIESAHHLDPACSCARIRQTAALAVRGSSKIKPLLIPGPHVLKIYLLPGARLDAWPTRGGKPLGPQTAEFSADSLRSLPI
jgi:D-amino peptidase